jgi:AbrB family looped-hinge helix DNA binding protein
MCHTLVIMAQIAAGKVTLGAQGRLVLPAALRRALSLSAGDALVARAQGSDRIVLEKPSAARARLQERFAKVRGKGDLAASLIADRRSEARRDAR